MSDKVEKSSNDEGRIGDGGTRNPETISEDNLTLDSIRKIENVSAISQNMPRSVALEGSGDEIESELKELTKVFTITDEGKGNADKTAQTKASGLEDEKVGNISTGSDLNEAESSKTEAVPENDESNDEKNLKNIDDVNENDDEDMELRWEDDDSNVAAGDDSRNSDTKNNDVLSEDQLLEEPSDDVSKELPELHSDDHSKGSEKNLNMSKDGIEEKSLTADKTSKDDEPTNETEISPSLSIDNDIPTDMADDRNTSNILKDKYLRETDINAEMINSPEMDYSSEDSLDHHIKCLADKLSKETEESIKAPDIDQEKEITVEKDIDEPLYEKDAAENNTLEEVPSNDETKEILDDIIEEEKLLAESESDMEAETVTSKIPSLTDVILNQVNDNFTAAKNLLEDSIPEKANESTEIILKNKDKEDSDDVLLEEKLLEEPEIAGVISDADATMDVDDDKEGELLKDDESEEDVCTPMDVDITDTSIENQGKMDDKIEDSSMVDQSEVIMKDTDHISNMDQSDDQAETTVKVIDQPIEDTTKIVDTTIEKQSQTAEITKEIAVEEKIAAELEEIEEKSVDEPMIDKNREEDSEKDQSTVKSITIEQSDSTSKQTDTLPISNAPEVRTEEVKNEIEPEKPKLSTETVNPGKNLDLNSEKDEANEILDKTHDTEEISHKNYSRFPKDLDVGRRTGLGLHKPDVMIEIPTQELIDMDDTDFSMNLDQSEFVDSTNDFDEDGEHDETAGKIIALDEGEETVEQMVTEDVKPSDGTVDKDIFAVDTVNKTSVDPEAAETVKTADEMNSTVNKIAVVAEPTVSEVQTGDKVESPIVAMNDIVESAMGAMDDTVESAMGAMDDTVESATVATGDAVESTKGAMDDIVETATVARDDIVETGTVATDDTVETATVATDDIVESATVATDDSVESTTVATDDTVESATVAMDDTVESATVATDDSVESTTVATVDTVETATVATDDTVESATVATGDTVESTTVASGNTVETAMDDIVENATGDTIESTTIESSKGDIVETATVATGDTVATSNTVETAMDDTVENATGATGDTVESATVVTESTTVAMGDTVESATAVMDDKVESTTVTTGDTIESATVATGDKVESTTVATESITVATDDPVESATIATDDPVESATVSTCVKVEDVEETTVEENMEKMFADVVKEVSATGASTIQFKKPAEQPSAYSTQMTPDTSDEVPEISDSLGLLAESAGRMMDDEEPDDDDDADEDDDFDQDESSNQISAEQSEDSNPAALESEPPGDQGEKNLVTPDLKDEEFEYTMKMEVDIEEYGTLQLQAESMHEMNEETKSAVDALLRDNNADNQAEEQQEATEQMDIETVKLSDTSDCEIEPTEDGQAVAETSKEVEEQQKKSSSKSPSKSHASPKQSPSKLKNLVISTQQADSVVNIVDLEESSSEDEVQEVQKRPKPETTQKDKSSPDSDVTNVNIPTDIEIMCTSGGNTSEITTKEGEVVISGVPKPPPHKPARLNTSEVSIKTVSATEPIVIPETKMNELTQTQAQSKHKLSLEIFSLDSDDEDSVAKASHEMSELDKARETNKCINYCCKSDSKVAYKVAEPSEVAFYDANRKKRAMVCQPCADMVAERSKKLMQGIKDMTPIMDLEMGNYSHDLVQISDSESEDEEMVPEEPKEPIGEKGAKFIEDNLAKYLNDTWKKYDMDIRLKETQIMLDDEIERLEQDSKEIDAMLNECQIATDKLRNELYATFECQRKDLPPIILYDTPDSKFIGLEEELNPPPSPPTPSTPPTPPPIEVDRDVGPNRRQSVETRQAKRRLSSTSETPAKRPAIPLGYATLDSFTAKEKEDMPIIDYKTEDDVDVSVVKLSAESAPADLPPPGEISRPPLRVSMQVYAMKNAFGPWLKGKVLEIQPKSTSGGHPFSLCRVKFDHKTKNNGKVLPARCIAYSEPSDVRMTIGTRLIALFKNSNKRESYYSGVVSEIPTPMNNYRYLVFFDDGYAQYVQHQHTRVVCESSPLVWEEVHPFSREFVRKYLLSYPERAMVRLHEGQHLKTEWNGKWWSSRITRVDASLAQVMFVGDGRREWIYRGSTRLAPLYLELRAALRHRVRPMPRSKAQPRSNMPYVEYTRSDEPGANKHAEIYAQHQQQQQNEEIRRQRAVAKKSTSAPPQVFPPSTQQVAPNMDPVTSRVVYYTPKNAVKPLHMVPHKCTPKCKRNDVLSLKELRTYNPLAKPLLSGWERQIIRFKGHKEVMYRAPCGRRLRNMRELHAYLRAVASDLPVDLFDFHYSTHCLAEFVLNKCLVGKKDLSHGKENVPVPCVNYYDDSLPEFCSYNTERTPTAGVPLNLSPDFLCGCDCTDDCQDKSKCACWKMTLEGARTIGLKGPNVGYVYKRLPEPLPSGIYECNSRCKCKHTCLNRVAQHPLQLKLQVFKTPNRGWGIRALNDVPKGSFLCVYAGNLLTDATANLDGLNEGDEYLAELDYIEVVEQMKEGYEEDIPDADKKLDKRDKDGEGSDEEPSTSEEEDTASKTDKEDDDFRPGYIGLGVTEFSKRLRRREKSKKDKEEPTADEKDKDKETTKDSNTDTSKEINTENINEEIKENKQEIKEERRDIKEPNGEEDCITISDDEEVREPSRFMVQDNMKTNEYISKYKSVRTLFGMDEACYIMDAKVQGNIGRYLNHSCCPNVFVQNVFVDTHDPRFPWVAFFALSHIKAGTELTWNYNYDVGSVPGKILYCYCGAPNCRGRLL